ncbi:resolvase [Escherichia coli]|nr:resolvase [Escherichia coli]
MQENVSGRPAILNEEQKQKVLERIKSGASISAIAREFRTTRQTILRFRSKQKMLLYKNSLCVGCFPVFQEDPNLNGLTMGQ